MNSVKILHCADIHLGAQDSFLGENAAKRRFETLLTFEKIIDTAKANSVDFFLISGDLFDDNQIEKEFIDRVFELLADLSDSGIKTVYCGGNHDPLNSLSPFKTRSLPKEVYVLGCEDECISFEEKGVRVYGRSFEDKSLSGESRFSLTVPDDEVINIMVLHGELKSDLNSNYNAITPEFVKSSRMDYIALGHVHKKSGILKLEKTSFAYCGCPEGQGFDELDEKGVYIGEVLKGQVNLEFLPVSKRRHIEEHIDISQCENSLQMVEIILEKLKTLYKDDYALNLYKIVLTGELFESVRVSIDEITSRLENELFYVKVKDKTDIKINAELIAGEASLKGVFVKNMLELINNAPIDEKQKYKDALKLGISAFNTEVYYNED